MNIELLFFLPWIVNLYCMILFLLGDKQGLSLVLWWHVTMSCFSMLFHTRNRWFVLKYWMLLCLNGIFSWSFNFINLVGNKKKKKQRSTKKGEKKSFGVHFEVGVHFGALGHAFKSVAHDQIKEGNNQHAHCPDLAKGRAESWWNKVGLKQIFAKLKSGRSQHDHAYFKGL